VLILVIPNHRIHWRNWLRKARLCWVEGTTWKDREGNLFFHVIHTNQTHGLDPATTRILPLFKNDRPKAEAAALYSELREHFTDWEGWDPNV